MVDINKIISDAITDTVDTFGENNIPSFNKDADSEIISKAKDFKILMDYSNNLLQRYHSELQKALLNNNIKI